ncbi:hypothetical protein [Galbibacter sp. PAP.153]|uniref:hypothetical protein n=1 Tax=Galbibacter sp. PAP.153 TaxID=3104623 RepID=UPI00300A8D12
MGAVIKIEKQYLLQIDTYRSSNGAYYIGIPLLVSTYGQPLGTAPICVINQGICKCPYMDLESLMITTGNTIKLSARTLVLLSFPMGDDPDFLYESYKHFSPYDIKRMLMTALKTIGIPATNVELLN